jgi:hypothetical protein
VFTATAHALVQASQKGISVADVLAAADNPQVSYDNGRFPGQRRHIRNGVVAVVDPVGKRVITVYANVIETDVREDQTDADAKRYAVRRGQKARLARKSK